MTTAQFFEKFELFADAPDAVAKMRSLILELAVRGQLTSATSHPSASSDPSANPFPIPQDWQWVTLNDLGDTKPRNDTPDQKDCSFVPMAMIPAEYGAEPTHEARKWGGIKKGYTHFAEGDVVMAKITPCFENGKSAVMRNLTGNIGAGTTELHVFRGDSSKVLPTYVLIYLKSRGFIERGIPKMTGSAGQKRVPHDYFANSPLPLPPLAEQKRIVAKVDELMALCDRLEAQQQERKTKHTALAQATLARFAEAPTPTNLNLLFHSSFSIQPSDLRKTILTLAMHGQLGAHTQIKTVRLDSLGSWAQGCGFPVAEQGHIDRPILFSKVSDMNLPGNEREIKTTNNTIDDQTAKRLRIKVHPKGAVIFPKIGGAIATNKRRILTRPTAIDNNCSGIIPNETCSTEWLYLVLSGIDFAQYQTGTSVPAVNQGALGEIPVALPPLAEQKRIVAKVEELMALVDALEARQAAADQAATHLLDAVVSELAAAA